MIDLVLEVLDMRCEHCKMSITNALKKVKGVKKIEIDLNTKAIKISYLEKKTNKENIISTIESLGFMVTK